MRSSFFDFFPIPRILSPVTAGLSISEDFVRAMRFRSRGGRLSIYAYAEEALPEGAFLDGEIQNKGAILEAVKKAADKIKMNACILALPEEKSFVYTVNVAVPADTSLREAVKRTLTENIPMAIDDTVFDFVKISADPKNRTASVVVFAFPKEAAAAYAEILTEAGVTPSAFETESQAIARSVLPHGQSGDFLIVHFSKNKTIISVVSGGVVSFSSTVLGQVAASELINVREELIKVISYWHSERPTAARSGQSPLRSKIQSVIISGNITDMTDIADYISKHTRLKADLANVWGNAFSTDDAVPDINFDQSLKFAPAIGAALGSFGHDV